MTPFVEIAWQRAQAVFLPWIDAQPRKMVLRRYQPSDVLVKNRFGLLEPDRKTMQPAQTNLIGAGAPELLTMKALD